MLKKKQQEAITLLSSTSMNKKEIAEKIGIAPNTLSTWLRDEEFNKELDNAYREVVHTMMGTALGALKQCLNSNNDNVRLGAVKVVMESSGLFVEKKQIEVSGKGIEVSIDYGEDNSTT